MQNRTLKIIRNLDRFSIKFKRIKNDDVISSISISMSHLKSASNFYLIFYTILPDLEYKDSYIHDHFKNFNENMVRNTGLIMKNPKNVEWWR